MTVVVNTTLLLALSLCQACSSKAPDNTARSGHNGKPEPHASVRVAADPARLIAACVASGLPAEACKCSGDRAATELGAALLEKMASAPPDDDPTLVSYYEAREVQAIMDWVEDASTACGLEETK